MAGTCAKALAKDASSLWYWRPLQYAAAAKVPDLPVGSDLHLFRGHAEVWDNTEGGQRQDVSGQRKLLRSILALHPRLLLLTFCTGHRLLHLVPLMLPNCVGSTDARTWRLADGPSEALRFSFEGGVGRPKVGTDWCGNVKSITEQIQHT
jgi:hypothetical protein